MSALANPDAIKIFAGLILGSFKKWNIEKLLPSRCALSLCAAATARTIGAGLISL
jgi:hypothetical protein